MWGNGELQSPTSFCESVEKSSKDSALLFRFATLLGFLSFSYFGLGASNTVEEIEVIWPSGYTQNLENVPGGQVLTIVEEK